tara:strand:- start:34303 stop:34812 length:510 start_codon:yes stop_codon:yes gene_type:complete
MAVYNSKTKERRLEGQVISERGTFRMDMSMDEIVYWCTKDNHPKTEYLCGGDWYVERGSDLSPENEKAYYTYQDAIRNKRLLAEAKRLNEALKIGSHVKVYKGRKVPVGIEGEVTYIKDHGYSNLTVGIRHKSGKIYYTYSNNIELLCDGEWTHPLFYVSYTKELLAMY